MYNYLRRRKKKKTKALITAVLILLLAAAGVVVYFFTQPETIPAMTYTLSTDLQESMTILTKYTSASYEIDAGERKITGYFAIGKDFKDTIIEINEVVGGAVRRRVFYDGACSSYYDYGGNSYYTYVNYAPFGTNLYLDKIFKDNHIDAAGTREYIQLFTDGKTPQITLTLSDVNKIKPDRAELALFAKTASENNKIFPNEDN